MSVDGREMNRARVRSLGCLGVVLALIGVVAFAMFMSAHTRREREAARIAEAKAAAAARAVRELPPGVQAAWERYTDNRLDRAFHVEPGGVRIDGALGRTIVSRNTPYRVFCLGTSISVIFGVGEDAPTATILGYSGLDTGNEPGEPALGVSPESVAAEALSEALCARVSQRVSGLMDDADHRTSDK